jgi:hypothetical protein
MPVNIKLRERLSKYLSFLSAGIFIFCVASNIVLDLFFAQHRPRSPQLSLGYTHPFRVSHGTLVFLSLSDLKLAHFFASYIFWLGCASFVFLVGLRATQD